MSGLARREFLAVAGCVSFCLCSLGRVSWSKADNERKIYWEVPAELADVVAPNLPMEGVNADRQGGPLVIFAGLVLIPYLANAIYDFWQKMYSGGIVIDARGAELIIKSDSNLPGNTILLVGKNGEKLYQRSEIPDQEVLASLLKGL
jgi:hypothetical protein